MATPEQLEEGIRRAHAAGDANAVRALGSQLVAMRQQQAAPKPGGGGILGAINNVVSSGNEMLIGGLEGLYNAASAVTDPIARKVDSLIEGDDAANANLAAANRGRRAVSDAAQRTFVSRPNPIARDVGRVAGAMAVPLPGKKLQEGGRLARAAYRAMQGAVGGAAVRDVDEDAGTPAAIGAAANVVLPPVVSRVAAPISRVVAKAASPITDLLGITSRAAPAVDRPLAALGPEAEQRAAEFADLGVKPTTAMVTRDPRAWNFEQEIGKRYGVGDDLLVQMQDVEKGLISKGQELVDSQGGAKGAEETGIATQKALDAKRSEMQQVTGRLYDQVRDQRGDELVGRLDGLREKMSDPDVVDNAVFDQMREGLTRRMERLGVIGKSGSLSKGVTVRQAEELRKFIGGLGSNTEPGVRMMRGRLIDALDDDVVNAVGDDAFKAARESAKARFQEFGKTFAGKIADEGIAPEALTKRVLGANVRLSDLRDLKQSLHTGTPDQVARGAEAWGALKSQALEDLLNGALGADGKLNGGTLYRTFGKQADKFKELLEPADFNKLKRLVTASRNATVAPPMSGVNYSNTAAALGNMFANSPAMLRDGWLKLLAKNGMSHVAAWSVAGPTGNLALWGAKTALDHVAEGKSAIELLKRIQMAQNPDEAAAAVRELQGMAKSNPAIADFLNRSGILGGTAAAVADQ